MRDGELELEPADSPDVAVEKRLEHRRGQRGKTAKTLVEQRHDAAVHRVPARFHGSPGPVDLDPRPQGISRPDDLDALLAPQRGLPYQEAPEQQQAEGRPGGVLESPLPPAPR